MGMENWCYDPATVYDAGLARHYETGEPLPRELFDKLCEQRTYQAGMGMLRQLFFGALDMELHHRLPRTASCAASATSSPAATRLATTRTSGRRCSVQMRSPRLRRLASTMMTRCARWGGCSATQCWRLGAGATRQTCTAISVGVIRRLMHFCATVACWKTDDSTVAVHPELAQRSARHALPACTYHQKLQVYRALSGKIGLGRGTGDTDRSTRDLG